MIITDIDNLQELNLHEMNSQELNQQEMNPQELNLQEMPSDHSPEAREARRRHREPSGERETERRARSSACSTSSWWNQVSRHSRRVSSSCSRDHSTSSRRPSGEVSYYAARPCCRPRYASCLSASFSLSLCLSFPYGTPKQKNTKPKSAQTFQGHRTSKWSANFQMMSKTTQNTKLVSCLLRGSRSSAGGLGANCKPNLRHC